MHYVGSSQLLGGCSAGHSLFHVETDRAVLGEGLQSMGQPSCCEFISFHLIWGSCFLLGDWFIITVKPRNCFSVCSLWITYFFHSCLLNVWNHHCFFILLPPRNLLLIFIYFLNVYSRRTCWYWGKLWNPSWLSASSVYQMSTLQSKNR